MLTHLYIALVSLIVAGLACLVAGLILLIRGYINKNKRSRVGRGWLLSILGSTMLFYFLFLFSWVLKEGEDIIHASLLLLFLFFPLAMLFVLLVSVFFLLIGVSSLKEGFKRDAENKKDVISIVLGFLMITLLVVVLTSLVMFAGFTFDAFGKSLRRSYNKSSSIPISESAKILKYYLFSIIYK